MAQPLNETHDPARRSFVQSANTPDSDFPIQNLPYCVYRPASAPSAQLRVGVAIGDQVLDVAAAGPLLGGAASEVARASHAPFLNPLMSMGPQAWSTLRLGLSRALSTENSNPDAMRQHLTPMSGADLKLPVAFRNFTDFFASVFHATNAGRMFRPDAPLNPNYKYVPVAYHSRASSVRISGTPVKRPLGQRKGPNDDAPIYGPSRNLDFELELGAFIGTGSELGKPVPIGSAGDHVFGYCLLNDWSARDVQAWEYQPLGPFLGKNFGTTISPWVVPAEALAPFRTAAYARPEGDPAPLPHLDDAQDRASGGLGITLEAYFLTEIHAPQRDSAASHHPDFVCADLLDDCANGCASHQQWLQP